MTKHTQGPWFWKKYETWRGEWLIALKSGKTTIMELDAYNPPSKANMDLIKTAPALLEACKEALDCLYYTASEMAHMGGINKVAEKLISAIAKTEGE